MTLTSLILSGVCCLVVAQAEGLPEAAMAAGTVEVGSAIVTPESGVAGEFGTWTVTYTVGDGGIEAGGGIRVQFPDTWHAGPRNSANRLQASDPKADHYVTATASREGVVVEGLVESESEYELVKHAKVSLDGRFERYVFVSRVIVRSGRLEPGDTISVTYGDRSAGSRGYRVGGVTMAPTPILIALDAEGDNTFHRISDTPDIAILPGAPAEMMVHAPSQAVVGEFIDVVVALVDREFNAVAAPADVAVSVTAGNADVPASAVSVPEGQGYLRFRVRPTAPGVLRLRGEAADLGLTANSNPVEVLADAPETRLYWGELHSHSQYSWDGVGTDAFNYARNISALDFYAMTDHAMAPPPEGTRGLNRDTWPAYAAAVEAHNDPPHFVTIHAYECSFGAPYGHHNVFFRGKPGPMLYPHESTLPELWKVLEAGNALTIPHHTGKFPRVADLSIHDPELRRNFEIYSGHGLSEVYDPEHPLAFEQSTFTSDSVSLDEPTHAQDAWRMGLWLSTVAASDDHRSQPGQPQYGLTAVRAPKLGRDDVFQALYDRVTYGTTGERIILDFTLNGATMGQQVKVNGAPQLAIRVIGTRPIEWIEVLCHRPGDAPFGVIKRWAPGTLEFEGGYVDEAWEPGSIYYVRVRERGEVRGRAIMAWSSPIWTLGE